MIALTALGRRELPCIGLRILDAGHLFAVNVTRLGLRKGAWLRGYAYSFVELFAPTLTKEVVTAAFAEAG